MTIPKPPNVETRDALPMREERSFPIAELRADSGEGEQRTIKGHAAVFNKKSEDLGGFVEKIAPGAFADTLDADVRALFNHSPDYVLGRTKAGTLRMEEDKKGLAVEIDPPDTSFANDLMVSIERGDISQMSFGFRVLREEWDEKPKTPVRTLHEVELFDVSPVTFPAYTQTKVAVRSADQVFAEYTESRRAQEQDAQEPPASDEQEQPQEWQRAKRKRRNDIREKELKTKKG